MGASGMALAVRSGQLSLTAFFREPMDCTIMRLDERMSSTL
jgi:hypothetical protein